MFRRRCRSRGTWFHSSYCSFTPEGCLFGYVVSTTWREDLFRDWWWLELMMNRGEKDLFSPSFCFDLFEYFDLDLILWMFFCFFDAVNFFVFFYDFVGKNVSLWMFVLFEEHELIEENEFCWILRTPGFFCFIIKRVGILLIRDEICDVLDLVLRELLIVIKSST